MIVTCWYRDLGEGLQYNHYSQGFDPDAERPPYMFESQRIAWQKGVWIAKKAVLENNAITEES